MSAVAEYMDRALALARKGEGRTRPNPAVGAVIVAGAEVVGEGYHPEAGQPHAEIFALRQAGVLARGADLYVTLEPCSHQGRTGPCADAVIAAGIARVFVGVGDPNPQVGGRGIDRLRAAGIEVQVGIREAECRRLIAPFAKHVTTGLPLVTLKSAVTLDGKTATATGDSQWISGPASRLHVHRLRDRVDAILVGVGTVLHDDPQLTTRLPEGGRNPLRVVVDSRLRIPADARLLRDLDSAPTLIATTSRASSETVKRLGRQGVETLVLDGPNGRVDLPALLVQLGQRGVQHLLLEGGSGLNNAMLQSGLIDRMMVFVAPKLVGGSDGFGIFAGAGVLRLADAPILTDVRSSRFDDDILIEGEVVRCSPA
ncbi:MAG: riboflavin biosynthesis protein RibD [Desulfuromonadaceae bacterium GWC2_58_13]|nr:MAG: riboflavin biosynthesis protein RibD [Desulfuromonadaceae bacterium GWC2_58_13]